MNGLASETNVALVATHGIIDVGGQTLRSRPVTYTAGGEFRAYDRA